MHDGDDEGPEPGEPNGRGFPNPRACPGYYTDLPTHPHTNVILTSLLKIYGNAAVLVLPMSVGLFEETVAS